MQEDHVRHPVRQDTFDLRDQLISDDHSHQVHAHADNTYPSDEEHSVLEDDSDGEGDDFIDDDDGSSSLSIPNESIDFDLVYALHSFAATVEGQANVVKGDSLFLMDDSNSYWWLVRVLKTDEVGYIPAENIETPFERLARLNKHRNVDLASATPAELKEAAERVWDNVSARAGSNQATPSPTPGSGVRVNSRARSRQVRGVAFTPSLSVHRYPPAVWGDEEEDDEDVEWDDEGYEGEDPELAEEQERENAAAGRPPLGMEPDDGMSWEDGAVEDIQGKSLSNSDMQAQVIVVPDAGADLQEQARRTQQGYQQQRPQDGQNLSLRSQGAYEQQKGQDALVSPISPLSVSKTMDPAQVTETKKLTMTPAVARTPPVEPTRQSQSSSPGPLLPSAIMQQQEEERKRTREEIGALEDAARKKAKSKAASGSASDQAKSSGGAKLRKDRDRDQVTTDDEGGKDKKKKSGGVFGGLFGRRKDKKDKGSSLAGTEGQNGSQSDIAMGRDSEESGISSNQQHTVLVTGSVESAPVLNAGPTQQLEQQEQHRNSTDPKRAAQQAQAQSLQQQTTPPRSTASVPQGQLSQHASQLRQRDQQQQQLYQQYLNRSPSSPPEPSHGLQSASAIMPGSTSFSSTASSASGLTVNTSRPRPGSLVLSPTAMDGQGVGLPDLSVVRIFAGNNLQTEATFKTVLLNSSTLASDLVRQAIQRFRLPAGEDENDYYLTIKEVEGSSAALLPHEKPLVVFETLVEAALELPKVKRSSVGSISSVASNLSMHPAIKKLSMNDFTDDSAVKFYLNRRGEGRDDSFMGDEGDETLQAESTHEDDTESLRPAGQFLTVSTAGANTVSPERFSSPSYRFNLQLLIHPEDLPDDMVFDPLTEAIVFKHTLRDRTHTGAPPSSGISQTQRRKVFVFPKNVTVAEVIELGLERFGILEGVVDGGDEVEDKLTKRRSSSRVRYGLTVDVAGRERELSPSSKVIEAFPRPPTYRAAERRTGDSKRRSVDSAQLLLGSNEDISPDDPTFVLRRAVAYRTARHRLSAPLDEIALQHLHRESVGSSSAGSESNASAAEEPKSRQKSKQEIIAAQRAASLANQRAILSAQTNSARGLDVLLPGNAMIRSSRYEVDNRMRYSYVEPDGETYDISDIVEEEWRSEAGQHRERGNAARDDLLRGVLSRGGDGLGAELGRVLSKIKHEKGTGRAPVSQAAPGANIDSLGSLRSTSPSVYSTADGGTDTPGSRGATPSTLRTQTPTATQRVHSPPSRLSGYQTANSTDSEGRSRSRTGVSPTSQGSATRPRHARQQSATSVLSDASMARSVTPQAGRGLPAASSRAKAEQQRLYMPDDDFGLSQMMAVIESRGVIHSTSEMLPLDPVDQLLFGRPVNLQSLHPEIRDIYSDTFKQLAEMDQVLDILLQHVAHVF